MPNPKLYTMKKLLIFSLICSFSYGVLFAQTEISAFSATGGAYNMTFLSDYQCLGVNPANLAWTRNDHKMNIGFAEVTASIYSEPLTRGEVFHDLFSNEDWIDTESEKKTAVDKFTDGRLMGVADGMLFGFSYQDERFGGIAFNIRQRLFWSSILNDNAASFLFRGYDDPYFDAFNQTEEYGYSTNPAYASTVYKGTDQHHLLTLEFSMGYARKLWEIEDDIVLYGGMGIKYIIGYGGVQYYQNENGALSAFSALSPFYDVDYGTPTPSAVTGEGLKKVGHGFGYDFGTTFRYRDLKVAVSLNDIGSIYWDGNVYKGNDVKVYKCETDGINNYNIFEQGELIVTDNAPDDPNEWEGIKTKNVKLPIHLRGGGSYRIMDQIEVGADIYIPLGGHVPGRFDAPIFGMGAHYDPIPWLQLSAGILAGGGFGANIPFGITFIPVNNEKRSWSLGVATRDLLTWISQDNPNVSLCFGFLRFSFGPKINYEKY